MGWTSPAVITAASSDLVSPRLSGSDVATQFAQRDEGFAPQPRTEPLMTYDAIIIGGTGAVGRAVLSTLLSSERCTSVTAIVRRPVDIFEGMDRAALGGRDKLTVEQVDYAGLEEEAARLSRGAEVAFCTVGIGQPRKVDPALFRKVDVEYAGAFARGCAASGVRHISLLSSVGTKPDSRNGYLRVKADAERAVSEAGCERTSLFRPSLLATDDIRYGPQDRITQSVFPLVSWLLPAQYREIHVKDLGRAMVLNAERSGTGVEILRYPEFKELLQA